MVYIHGGHTLIITSLILLQFFSLDTIYLAGGDTPLMILSSILK